AQSIPAGEHFRTDDLVDRVVTPDIFAQQRELPGIVEQGCGVQSAGTIENGLLAPNRFGHSMDDRGIDARRILRQDRTALHPQRFYGSFAANAATRAGIEMPL